MFIFFLLCEDNTYFCDLITYFINLNPKPMTNKTMSFFALIVLMLAGLFACQQTNPANEAREIEPPFCHHVYFWLNNPDDPADRAAFEKGIKALLEIPEIKAYHVGIPATTEVRGVVDASYTYSYAVFFDNDAGHDIYQDHPLHQQFIDDCSHLWNKVIVYDSVVLQK